MTRDKDWIYGSWQRTPSHGQPTVRCDTCGRSKNALSVHSTGGGKSECVACIRGQRAEEAPIDL